MIYLDVDGVIADFEAGLKVLGWKGIYANVGMAIFQSLCMNSMS